MSGQQNKYYDVCFIGAGLSCSYTLLHYVKLLEQSPQLNKIHICIIDKVNEFWTGIPYGRRSGADSLIITSIKEFLPETEREIFISWLEKNFEKISKDYTAISGAPAHKWLKGNADLIAGKYWSKLYVPRYIFGQFLTERITTVMNAAKEKGLLSYELMAAEVTGVLHNKNKAYEVFFESESGEKNFIQSKKVILSIGSPPKKELNIKAGKSENFICIQDVYNPGMHENIDKALNFLEVSGNISKKNVLILGSNASSLEVIYNLQNAIQQGKLINKFYILSPNGIFPYRINENKTTVEYEAVNLTALRNSKYNTCVQILEAVRKDVANAIDNKIEIADVYDSMSHVVIDLLNNLDQDEQKKFVCKYGVEIGKLQRRAGSEYLDIVEKLICENKLEFIKGRFLQQLPAGNDGFQFEYLDISSNQKKVLPQAIDVVVNCIGSEDISDSLSPLIQNLIKQKICTVNDSNKGFEVDEDFQSSKNFFVIGPLLSGTLNKKLRIWHAESCPRIFFLAQQLAESINND